MEPEGSLPHSQAFPILNEIDPVHTPHTTSWRSILILSSHLRLVLPSVLFPSGFPTKILHGSPVSYTRYMPHPLFLLDFITRTILDEQYRSLSSSLCSFPHSLVTSSLLMPKNILNTLFSNTLSLRSSVNVSDQVSHPYKTTSKIIFLGSCHYGMARPLVANVGTASSVEGSCNYIE